MREILITGETPKGNGGWGYRGITRKSQAAHTVARAIAAARKDADALVVMVDSVTEPKELIRIALERVRKDAKGIRVGYHADGRPFVTLAPVPAGAVEWNHPPVREGAP